MSAIQNKLVLRRDDRDRLAADIIGPMEAPDGRRLTGRLSPQHRSRVAAFLIEIHGQFCWLCGRRVELEDLTLDHVIPRSKGGRNSIANLRLAHLDCNMKRRDGPIPELLLDERLMLPTSKAAGARGK